MKRQMTTIGCPLLASVMCMAEDFESLGLSLDNSKLSGLVGTFQDLDFWWSSEDISRV